MEFERIGPWDVFESECAYLHYTQKILFELNEILATEGLLRTIVIESCLLHLRAVVEILLSRNSDNKFHDNITLEMLVGDYKPVRLEELKEAYGDFKTEGSPCWTINKRLVHPTTWRTTAFNYELIAKLQPIIGAVLEDVRAHRPKQSQPTNP